MKLATRNDGSRDGSLVVVRRDGRRAARTQELPATLQAALDDWETAEPRLRDLSARLDSGATAGEPLNASHLLAPLPRAYEWLDGSAYPHHIRLARAARGAEPPPRLLEDPLVYQGGSGHLLAPRSPIELPDAAFGLDFEAEVCALLGDVERGTRPTSAEPTIRLLTICNDLTYRHLVPGELAKGFGFVQAKPATAFAPFAVTLDELGTSFQDGRLSGWMECAQNGRRVARVNAGVGMHFSFLDLIAHVARTRRLGAGTLLGSGTVSNDAPGSGTCCIAEARAVETLERGEPHTRFLEPGDRLRIEMTSPEGESLFGAIEQEVVQA